MLRFSSSGTGFAGDRLIRAQGEKKPPGSLAVFREFGFA
jgi:hypothetical protein